MVAALTLSPAAKNTAGILLLTSWAIGRVYIMFVIGVLGRPRQESLRARGRSGDRDVPSAPFWGEPVAHGPLGDPPQGLDDDAA
jgi:hypothetical protein